MYQIKTILLKRNPWPFTMNGQSWHLHFEYNRICINVTAIFWMLWDTYSNQYKYITYYWILTRTQSKLIHEPLHNARGNNKIKYKLLNLRTKTNFPLPSNICKRADVANNVRLERYRTGFWKMSWHILKVFVLKKWRKDIWRVCFIMMMWTGNIFCLTANGETESFSLYIVLSFNK